MDVIVPIFSSLKSTPSEQGQALFIGRISFIAGKGTIVVPWMDMCKTLLVIFVVQNKDLWPKEGKKSSLGILRSYCTFGLECFREASFLSLRLRAVSTPSKMSCRTSLGHGEK